MPVIDIQNLSRAYGEGDNVFLALNGVSLRIEQGECVAIVGQSGSGKSTLMNIVGCLDTPSSGRYLVDGVDAGALDGNALAALRGKKFGFIFQRYNLLGSMSALDNTALPAVYAGMRQAERLARAKRLLTDLGLPDKLDSRPNEMSGGQQQRVSIARALMNGGEIILADEPTGALDSKSGEQVMGILMDLNRRGHTVIVVTHDLQVASYAKRRIELKDGTIVADVSLAESRPAAAAAGNASSAACSRAATSVTHPTAMNASNSRLTASKSSTQTDDKPPSGVCARLKRFALKPERHENGSFNGMAKPRPIRRFRDCRLCQQFPASKSSPAPVWRQGFEDKSLRSMLSVTCSRLLFYKDQFMEALSMSVQAIFAHKLRSALTMLGIIIGIASVVSMVALGRGSQEQILSDISAMGTNTIDIRPGRGFGDRRAGRVRTLTVADCQALGEQSYITSATPITSSNGAISFRNLDVSAGLTGVGDQYFDVKGLEIDAGRALSEDDVKSAAAVVVIDPNTREKLFPDGGDPLGRIILFNRQPLEIVGVSKKQNMSFGPQDVLTLWTPYTTVMTRITGARHISSITVKVSGHIASQVAEKNLIDLLTVRHGGVTDFFTSNSDTIRQTVESATNTMTLLISCIAFISLVVGGIGVMNIMLVSVTERTREIGVRMAIGARQSNVLQQFLIEAVLLCILGGALGVLFSALIGLVFGRLVTQFAMSFSASSVLLALGCSSLIGILFGYMPARNASRLNPVDALSRE